MFNIMDSNTIFSKVCNIPLEVPLTVLHILFFNLKDSACDEDSFSFFATSSQEEEIEFPVPLTVMNESDSSESRYPISMSQIVTKKRGRKKAEPKTTVETTTFHPRFIVIPSVIVFKADGVFWPFRVESDIHGPFGLREISPEATSKPGQFVGNWGGRELIDINGTLIKVYEHAEIVLRTFHKKGIQLGVVEQTRLGGKVIHLLKLFDLDVFDYWCINEESEVSHMEKIRSKANVKFRDIVYVGTNVTTLEEMKELGLVVFQIKLGEGLQLQHINEIIHEFAIRPYDGLDESIDRGDL